MKAVIMAGGEGTRLRPQTSNLPKPMLPLVGRPMMEHIVSLLRRHGITDIVVTVAFLPNAIRSYFGDGSELGVRMAYATEESPLGTAGSVRNAREQLTERFLVISGDVLTDIDLTSVIAFHEKNQALATIALCAVENPLEFGIVITREDGTIERFLEKPGWGQVFSDTINTGIYVLETEIFDLIPEGRSVDFSGEVFPAALEAGDPLYGYVADGYWEDVGTTAAYLKAHEDILDGKVQADVAGFELRPGVWVGKGSSIDPSVRIDSPSFIGENCTIDRDTVLGAYTTVGANTQVEERAELQRSVIGENSYLGPAVRVEGAVLGRSCDLRVGARVEPGAVVGEGCLIGAHAEVRSDVKVYPYKVVEAGAQVNASIVWESGGSRTLFGREGVQGIANVDISPELAVRLAKAWASGFEKGSYITASRDTSRVARVLKRALMVGCNSVGVNVNDLELATVPVTRHHVRMRGNRAGLTVRLSPDDPQSVVIRFFDERGIDLSDADQRRVERMYHREEFRRVTAGDIGDIDFSPRTIEFYTAGHRRGVRVATRRRTRSQVGAGPVLWRGELRDAQPALEDARRRAEHQPLCADAGHDLGRPHRERSEGGRRGARFGGRPRRGDRCRRGAVDAHRRHGARADRRRGGHGLHRAVDDRRGCGPGRAPGDRERPHRAPVRDARRRPDAHLALAVRTARGGGVR